MRMLNQNPAAAYRRVALEARIEASGGADLTRICLEEALGALGQALIVLERSEQDRQGVRAMSSAGHPPLVRAQSILLWLARSVAPEHPLGASLKAFYGGLAAQIGGQILQPDARRIEEIRSDIRDLLEAAG
jgi:flagellin-specific chaperone FliS